MGQIIEILEVMAITVLTIAVAGWIIDKAQWQEAEKHDRN